ncbi:MAG: hypothetical protein ACE5OQ_04750 [Woeseia sp.]
MLHKPVHVLAATCCLLGLSPPGSGQDDEPVVEEGERCISSRPIKRTEVVDDYTILFYMRGKAVYRNDLPRRCRRLSREKRFLYRTTVARICKSDQITVLADSGTSMTSGPTCQLGRFYRISRQEADALLGDHDVEPQPLPPAEPEEPAVKTESEDSRD